VFFFLLFSSFSFSFLFFPLFLFNANRLMRGMRFVVSSFANARVFSTINSLRLGAIRRVLLDVLPEYVRRVSSLRELCMRIVCLRVNSFLSCQ